MKRDVLILIEWFLPAFRAGGPIVSVKNLVESLKDEFNFWILTSDYDYPKIELQVPVNRWLEMDGYNVFYASSVKYVLEQLVNFHYDVLIVNGIYSPVFSILPVIIGRKPIILFPRGMLSEHSFKVKSLKKRIFVLLSKLLGLYRNVLFVATSEAEYLRVKELFRNNQVYLIENIVSSVGQVVEIEKEVGQLRLVSVARVSPVKNYDFGLKVLKGIDFGKIIWHIYGNIESKQYLNRLQTLLEQLPKNIEVVFKGPVNPESLRRTISKYHFFYLPTLGENFGHSIFESFAVGRPVIISNNTPWQNLEKKAIGWDLPLEQKLWTQTIIKALNLDNQRFQLMCKNAYQFAKHYVDNSKQIDTLKRLIYKTLNRSIK